MSLAKIVLSGKVLKTPEKRFTAQQNVSTTEFWLGLETTRNDETFIDPIKVITWREQADRVANDIKKDDIVICDGRLQIKAEQTEDGWKREVQIDCGGGNVELMIRAKQPVSKSTSDLDEIFK
jgi:single-strand DNA-binding protein